MLPDNLVSVYQQYKKDTNAVASWLASTAKSCGYPADLLCGSSSQTTGPGQAKRLKGKARKEAKAGAAKLQSSSSCSTRPEYAIAIKDFIPLAEFVAASRKPIVSVPLAFANKLDRVISTRYGFGTRLVELGNSTDASADSKHSYFVGVLEKVREVLRPRVSPASQDAATVRTPSDPIGEVGGRFAGLSVDNPSEEFLNAPDIEMPVKAKDENATYVAEPLKDLQEVLFAYTLMINDLDKIRARIQWIWTNYRDGSFELVAAAIATNTACDLARNLMEDMAPMFKAHGGAKQIAKRFYVSECIAKGFALDQIVKSGNEFNWDSPFNCDTYDIANDTYMIPLMMIKAFLDIMNQHPPGEMPIYVDDIFDTYDPILQWNRLSEQAKFAQDRKLLTEILSEMLVLARCVQSYPVHDEFIRGMQELDRNREIPMYLVFTVQIFLDMNHILHGQVYSARETCMSHLRLMDEDLELHMQFHAKFRSEKRTASEKLILGEVRNKIKWVLDDPIQNIKSKMSQQRGDQHNVPKHRILNHSPVISGLLLYHFRTTTYLLSLRRANSSGSITFPLHLYTALKHEKVLSPQEVPAESWEDMVMVLAILGKDSFYVSSELPKDPVDYIKMLALQMGTTATLFSKNKHKRLFNPETGLSKGGARRIKGDCAPVSDMFIDRYVRNTGQVDWTPEHVDRVISRSLHEEVKSGEDFTIIFNQIRDPVQRRERKRNIAAEAAGKKTSTAAGARLSPEQLIKSLAVALQAESLTLVFPYLTLQRAAWGMIQATRDACETFLLDLYGPAHANTELQLAWVVSRILSELASGNDRLLVRAGAAVKEQLQRGEGGKAIQRLESMGYKVLRGKKDISTVPPSRTFLIIEQNGGT